MKSYIIRIELNESDPLIWRRVVMPAGATFFRLHQVIQNVTNFMSNYGFDDYHLYEFELPEFIVTNDEEAAPAHDYYMKNRDFYEERLRDMKPEHRQFEQLHQERLKIEIKYPSAVKIDDVLERYGKISYQYDFGDGWEFTIYLEDVVNDYYFGFPTLLMGAETAPPEDVGGMWGYYDFLEIYRDPKHPDYQSTVEWAEMQRYREYNPDFINGSLKMMKYKKTEWGKINHKRYLVIKDKYRKSDVL